jgi:methylenetetrahydrofolate dehydrogenase (NADP+)/methenyltetrahydrofolate cyclohydrolase
MAVTQGVRIDGKAVAGRVREEIRARVTEISDRVRPGLATVLVGDDPASAIYVRNKGKACAKAGIKSIQVELPASTGQPELLATVDELNSRDDVHGILVQLPLPDGLDEKEVIERISPAKDVDGLHPTSQGRLLAGVPGPRPCTPLGIMRLIDEAGVDPKGKRAVVVGRSLLVGKPVGLLLLERHATVTYCHSRTSDLAAEVGRADILVAAIGKPRVIQGAWIKPGSTVIDVGVNRTDEGLVGDVDYETAVERAAHITPVPGGVGPMTIAMLLFNTVEAALASVSVDG